MFLSITVIISLGFIPLSRCEIANWDDISTYTTFLQFSRAAYCNNIVQNQNWTCGVHTCQSHIRNATILGTFGEYDGMEATGFVSVHDLHGIVAVSFRGTQGIDKMLTDLKLTQKNPKWKNADLHHPQLGRVASHQSLHLSPRIQLHRGISDAYRKRRDAIQSLVHDAIQIYPNYTVVFTGHSLGAAHAAIAALDSINLFGTEFGTRVKVYNFAQPRTGNADWAKAFDNAVPFTRRFTKFGDPVPHSPLIAFGYYHHTNEIFIDQDGSFHTCKPETLGESGKGVCMNKRLVPIPMNHKLVNYAWPGSYEC